MLTATNEISGHFLCRHCKDYVPKELDNQRLCGPCFCLLENVTKAQQALRNLAFALNAANKLGPGVVIKVTFAPGGAFESVGVLE